MVPRLYLVLPPDSIWVADELFTVSENLADAVCKIWESYVIPPITADGVTLGELGS
jgi:hypothetical protein